MIIQPSLKHWRIQQDHQRIAWIYFDKHNSAVNTLGREVMDELAAIVTWLQGELSHLTGVVFASSKSTGFIAGADIHEFHKFKDIEDAIALLKKGQAIYQSIESLGVPTVAMIDGFCLGGGFELALACRYRVVSDSLKTKIGLPEVLLGIYPGWGGTIRTLKLLGGIKGLNFILSGRNLNGKQAEKMGLVDVVVPARHLQTATERCILETPAKKPIGWLQKITYYKPIRTLIAHIIRKKLRQKIHPLHYPAPFQLVDNWELTGVSPEPEAYHAEAKNCGKLFFSETSQNLVRVFFLQEKLKSLGKSFQQHFHFSHVHVIGAGTMGGDIAAWCALQGMQVTLQDIDAKYIAPAIQRAAQFFKDKLKEPHLIQKAMDRLMPDVLGVGVKTADVIIEAVIEDVDIKKNILLFIEQNAKADAIIATNTSSIPLDELSAIMHDKTRLIGIHFFNPVAKMQLVEVVISAHTSTFAKEAAIAFVRKIDRLPLPVKSSPGFLINRILMPYLMEAMNLLDSGIPAHAIDQAMRDFGMPMGPVTLADTIGLDVCYSVATYLSGYFNAVIPARLTQLVNNKKYGKKSRVGFYNYDQNGKIIKSSMNLHEPSSLTSEEISSRLILVLLKEVFQCLQEKVVENEDLLDAGMIFGTGFPPFLGGPVHYAKHSGVGSLYEHYRLQYSPHSSTDTIIE